MPHQDMNQTNPPANGATDRITVVLTGHCGPDAYMLRSTVERALPDATVVMVNDEDELRQEHWRPDRVLLVNRVLDGDFSREGLDLIAEASSSEGGPVALLISNFADAQQKASAAGGLPGFGKQALYSEETTAKLRAAVDRALDTGRATGDTLKQD